MGSREHPLEQHAMRLSCFSDSVVLPLDNTAGSEVQGSGQRRLPSAPRPKKRIPGSVDGNALVQQNSYQAGVVHMRVIERRSWSSAR